MFYILCRFRIRLSLFLESRNDEVNESYGDCNVNDVPNCAPQGELEERLEQEGEGCEDKAQSVLFRLEIVVCQIGEGESRRETDQRVESVGHVC